MRKSYITVFMLMAFASLLQAQELPVFEKAVYQTRQDSLPYRLLYPQNYNPKQKYPLLLFLHGMGVRGNDNQKQIVNLPKALLTAQGRAAYHCFILVPQCPGNDVWVKFPEFPKSLSATVKPTKSTASALALLANLQQQLPIDRNRIYVMGNSMGGEATFDFLARKPKLFAGAIPICAVADTATARRIYRTPIWAFHGNQDDVNDVKYTRMMVDALRQRGGKPKYTEYPGIKHNSWDKAYAEPELFDWLFAQSKK